MARHDAFESTNHLGRARSTLASQAPIGTAGRGATHPAAVRWVHWEASDERARDECTAREHARRSAARLLETGAPRPTILNHPSLPDAPPFSSSASSRFMCARRSASRCSHGPCASPWLLKKGHVQVPSTISPFVLTVMSGRTR